MPRKVNVTWTQPLEQRAAPRSQRYRHAARRNVLGVKTGPVCVVSVVSCWGDLARKERRGQSGTNNTKRTNLWIYRTASLQGYWYPWSHQYGGGYQREVRPYWPSDFSKHFSQADDPGLMYPYHPEYALVTHSNPSLTTDTWLAPPTYNPTYGHWDDSDTLNNGKPYWQLKSSMAREKWWSDPDEGYPTNYDLFTHDWASFRNNFRDQTIEDRVVSEVPVYALWSRSHDVDRTHATYNWPSITGTWLRIVSGEMELWRRYWAGADDPGYDRFIAGTNIKLVQQTKVTNWMPTPPSQGGAPDSNMISSDTLNLFVDQYKRSSGKWNHIEFSFNPPLITSGNENSGKAWGSSYNAWDTEVFPQWIKDDKTSSWFGSNMGDLIEYDAGGWSETGLSKPTVNSTVSDWFTICGFTADQDGVSEKGNIIRRVLLYIEENTNKTINGAAYKLFKEKATNAGLIVKCLTPEDTKGGIYYSDALGLGQVHNVVNTWLFGADEEAEAQFAPGYGFDQFGAYDDWGNQIAAEDESLWLDYPSRPDDTTDPTSYSNRWFRTAADAASH